MRQLRILAGRRLAAASLAALLTACGGGGGSGGANVPNGDSTGPAPASSEPDQPTTAADAARLAAQASFGATEPLIAEIQQKGPRKWLLEQFGATPSRYTAGGGGAIDQWSDRSKGFCDQFAAGSSQSQNCWRDWYSATPLQWDFYRQAVNGTDQLRQRVAFALSQIFVVSENKVTGTYGMRAYQQMLRDEALGNYRTLLADVATSPAMGEYLDMVDNDGKTPNENFARELLQLFSVGPCLLNADGTRAGGECQATYDNARVREYAYALSGWTYPKGGVNRWCSSNCGWTNPRYLSGAMQPVAAHHDDQPRTLLSGVQLAASRTPQQALDAVLDSLFAHPNLAPFVAERLIRFLVTSNPSPAYVGRVAQAFRAGLHAGIGTGQAGDMRATVAAVLLDAEARNAAPADAGLLREPALLFAGSVRAFDGVTDGDAFGWWWGSTLNQRVFASPTVFNYYPQDFPLGDTGLVGPQFAIEDTRALLERINYANALVNWRDSAGAAFGRSDSVPNATGTTVSFARWEAAADQPGQVVDRLDLLLTGGRLAADEKQAIVDAMNAWTSKDDQWLTGNGSNYRRERVKAAAHVLLASPQFQVIR